MEYKWIIGRKVEKQYYSGWDHTEDRLDINIMDNTTIIKVTWTSIPKEATRFDSEADAQQILQFLHLKNICLKSCEVIKIQVVPKKVQPPVEDEGTWI